MPLKDYFKFFTVDPMEKSNYSIIFKEKRPDIDDHINSKELRGWLKAGDKGYKVLTSLSKEKLESFIIEELKIAKDDFQIVTHNEFWAIGRW